VEASADAKRRCAPRSAQPLFGYPTDDEATEAPEQAFTVAIVAAGRGGYPEHSPDPDPGRCSFTSCRRRTREPTFDEVGRGRASCWTRARPVGASTRLPPATGLAHGYKRHGQVRLSRSRQASSCAEGVGGLDRAQRSVSVSRNRRSAQRDADPSPAQRNRCLGCHLPAWATRPEARPIRAPPRETLRLLRGGIRRRRCVRANRRGAPQRLLRDRAGLLRLLDDHTSAPRASAASARPVAATAARLAAAELPFLRSLRLVSTCLGGACRRLLEPRQRRRRTRRLYGRRPNDATS